MTDKNTPKGEVNPSSPPSSKGVQMALALEARPDEISRPSQRPHMGSSNIVKIEKNLASLGFFSPSHKRIQHVKQKVVTLSRDVNGKRTESRATILPSAQYGLPTTADQDTYLAILKLTTEMHRKYGKVTNPIGFTSAELLRIQAKSCVSGYHYKELHEQLMRIKTATIVSEGAVYFAGKKVWAKDAFSVITRLVLLGAQMEDGTVAAKHYVWFSDWQLENINNNYLLPIDYESYKQLKNHIAKILVPLLQIWLYASREAGCFEKRYEEICQFLNIRVYEHVSKIKEKFGPSLNELQKFGYLSNWSVERTRDGNGYKIIFYHGEKFHRDMQRRTGHLIGSATPKSEPTAAARYESYGAGKENLELLAELTARGISPERARELLENTGENQQVLDQLEWGDHLVAQSPPAKIYNPPGFYIHLVQANITPPANFETSRKKRLLEETEKSRAIAREEEIGLDLAYEEYRNCEINRYIAEQLPDGAFQKRLEAKKEELLRNDKRVTSWKDNALTDLAKARVRAEIAQEISVMKFTVFREQPRQFK